MGKNEQPKKKQDNKAKHSKLELLIGGWLGGNNDNFDDVHEAIRDSFMQKSPDALLPEAAKEHIKQLVILRRAVDNSKNTDERKVLMKQAVEDAIAKEIEISRDYKILQDAPPKKPALPAVAAAPVKKTPALQPTPIPANVGEVKLNAGVNRLVAEGEARMGLPSNDKLKAELAAMESPLAPAQAPVQAEAPPAPNPDLPPKPVVALAPQAQDVVQAAASPIIPGPSTPVLPEAPPPPDLVRVPAAEEAPVASPEVKVLAAPSPPSPLEPVRPSEAPNAPAATPSPKGFQLSDLEIKIIRSGLQDSDSQGFLDSLQVADNHAKDALDNGVTFLNLAAQANATEVVKKLIKEGAEVNVKGINNTTPLHHAAFNGNVEMIEVLIENKADVNAQGGYKNALPIEYIDRAPEEKRAKVEELLRVASSPPIQAVPIPVTEVPSTTPSPEPLATAAPAPPPSPSPKGFKLSEADIKTIEGGINKMPDVSRPFHLEILNSLKDADDHARAQFKGGATLLHLAVKAGAEGVAHKLVNAGADVNAKDEAFSSPLDYAVANRDDTIIAVLNNPVAPRSSSPPPIPDLAPSWSSSASPAFSSSSASPPSSLPSVASTSLSSSSTYTSPPSFSSSSASPPSSSSSAAPSFSLSSSSSDSTSMSSAAPSSTSLSSSSAYVDTKNPARPYVAHQAPLAAAQVGIPLPHNSMTAKEIQFYNKAILDLAGQSGKNKELEGLISVIGVNDRDSRAYKEAVGAALKGGALANANLLIEKGAKIQPNDLAQLCSPDKMEALSPEAQDKVCGAISSLLVQGVDKDVKALGAVKPEVIFENNKFQVKVGDKINTIGQKDIEALVKLAPPLARAKEARMPNAPQANKAALAQQPPQQQRPPVQQQQYALLATTTPGVFVQVPVITPAEYRQNLNDQMDKFLATEKDRFFAMELARNPKIQKFDEIPEGKRRQFEIYKKGQVARKENLLQQNFLQEEMATAAPDRAVYLQQKLVELQQIQFERDVLYEKSKSSNPPYPVNDRGENDAMNKLQYKQNPLIFEGHIETVRGVVKRSELNQEMIGELQAMAGKDAQVQAKVGAVNARVVLNTPKEAQELLEKLAAVHDIKGRDQAGKKFYPNSDKPPKFVVYVTPGEVQKVK